MIRREEGSRFSVLVVNGNKKQWMSHTVTRGGVPIMNIRQESRQLHDEIERALANALDYWRRQKNEHG